MSLGGHSESLSWKPCGILTRPGSDKPLGVSRGHTAMSFAGARAVRHWNDTQLAKRAITFLSSSVLVFFFQGGKKICTPAKEHDITTQRWF